MFLHTFFFIYLSSVLNISFEFVVFLYIYIWWVLQWYLSWDHSLIFIWNGTILSYKNVSLPVCLVSISIYLYVLLICVGLTKRFALTLVQSLYCHHFFFFFFVLLVTYFYFAIISSWLALISLKMVVEYNQTKFCGSNKKNEIRSSSISLYDNNL